MHLRWIECTDYRYEFELSLTTSAVVWNELSGEIAMPPGREYFTWWVDPSNADTAWMFGGFHYEPEQFTPAKDLWRLDLSRELWAEVSSTYAGPALGGAAVASYVSLLEALR